MSKRRLVGVNERGARVGESHHNAKLSDRECELIRQMHEEGLGYRALAKVFDVSRETIRDIVLCRRRAQTAARWVSRPGVRKSDSEV